MTPLRVAVTGATGFLGSHICDELVATGHRVRAAHRPSSSLRWLQDKPLKPVLVDLADPESLESFLDGCQAVVHCAGVVMADPATYEKVNVASTRLLLEAATRVGTVDTFVLISSLAAGGPGTLAAPRDETMPDAPISEYGRSKRRAEGLLFGGKWPFRTVSLRPPSLYGPRDHEFRPLLRLACRGWTARFGNALQGLSLVHGMDAATATTALLVASQATGVYYLDDGSGPDGLREPNRRWPWGYHLDEFYRVLNGLFIKPVRTLRIPLGMLGVASFLAPPRQRQKAALLHPDRRRDLTVPGWVCTAAKLRQDTGWTPQWELARGLRNTLDFYRRSGWLR
jgi:nucleoside-diphosphate-sugar epimerase